MGSQWRRRRAPAVHKKRMVLVWVHKLAALPGRASMFQSTSHQLPKSPFLAVRAYRPFPRMKKAIFSKHCHERCWGRCQNLRLGSLPFAAIMAKKWRSRASNIRDLFPVLPRHGTELAFLWDWKVVPLCNHTVTEAMAPGMASRGRLQERLPRDRFYCAAARMNPKGDNARQKHNAAENLDRHSQHTHSEPFYEQRNVWMLT